ncbi:unnamed protein product [Tilletia caries]|uniref:Secreted protein n=2 Tax=Tilletia TaxID=13289 RepID=A0A8X7MWQ4_9BASI|nr:hypothetical protein CF335_g4834 [Tilletia laevis]KAE8202331.1 hypothetical protein CF328_g2266 [Tilletia controversa]KAE8263093.1 hypothetical protein A4X03_0g1936 [Tilletia caries]KAE8196754.1 hypothetical protein CF336_g2478 [Tilletia laevis]KAE8251155.1 hypothetical protein A4X06_0g2796 [Tilletia controversa]
MFHPRLLLILPFLLLTTLVKSAPLPDPTCPSCPNVAPPSSLATRAGGEHLDVADDLLGDVFMQHMQTWESLLADARRLGFTYMAQLESVPPANRERVRQLLAQAHRAQANMNEASMVQQTAHYLQQLENRVREAAREARRGDGRGAGRRPGRGGRR